MLNPKEVKIKKKEISYLLEFIPGKSHVGIVSDKIHFKFYCAIISMLPISLKLYFEIVGEAITLSTKRQLKIISSTKIISSRLWKCIGKKAKFCNMKNL